MMNLLTMLYGFCALLLAPFTLGHGVLLIQYLRHRKNIPAQLSITEYPAVTVQLPIYNEQHVAMRLLEAVAALDYPADKLHIQVLDDSIHATSRLIAQHIRLYPNLRINQQSKFYEDTAIKPQGVITACPCLHKFWRAAEFAVCLE